MKFIHLRRALLGGLTAVVALALPAGASAATPSKLRIAYQAIPNGDLVVKNQKWLEKALPNTKIEWKQFDSGGAVNTAIAAGSIDIGLAGSSPVSRGLSNKLPYKVVWAHDVIGNAEALVVKNNITSLAQLKGKTVATPLASTSHYSLLAALKNAKVDPTSVKIIDAEPDAIYAAWTRGDIDGAYVWNPNLARIVKEGGRVLTDSAKLAKLGKTTYDLAVVSNSFSKKYPAAVQTWVAQQDKAVKLYRSNKNAWAKAVAKQLNLSNADVLSQAKGLIFLDAKQQASARYLRGGLAKNLYSAAVFNRDAGQIPAVVSLAAYKAAVASGPAARVAAK